MVLLVSVYLAGEYGGSITAIAIGTPGTPPAAATMLDGYELTKQGKPGLALTTSVVASSIARDAEVGLKFGTICFVGVGQDADPRELQRSQSVTFAGFPSS